MARLKLGHGKKGTSRSLVILLLRLGKRRDTLFLQEEEDEEEGEEDARKSVRISSWCYIILNTVMVSFTLG